MWVFCIILLWACTWGSNENKSKTESNTGQTLTTNTGSQMAKYEAPQLENGDIVTTITTNNGTIKIKLFTQKAPKTTTNFIGLSQEWYYDNVIFHRVIPEFMIQWWDPDGTGQWGESIYGEKFEDEFHPDLKNIRGTISMANAWPDTNGSQFFINVKDNNFLDNKHSVFWQVLEGMDVADKISKAKTTSDDKPETEIKMIRVITQEYKDGKLTNYNINIDDFLKKAEEAKEAKKAANKTREVSESDIVSVHYKGTLEDESIFDSSYERNEPINVDLSSGQVIPWFGKALVGMKIGEKKSISLAPSDAYGEYDENRTQDFPLTDLTAQGITPVEGETVPSMMWELKVIKVSEDTVTLDVNHPLAWKTLNFDLELVDFIN